MTTTIDNYLKEDIVSFAFKKIETYTNDRGEIKKRPVGMPNWKSINKDNCSNYSNGSAVGIITGKISNLTIIDFDNKHTYELLTEKHPDLKTYKTIQTKKGFHIWFRYDADFKTTTDGFTVEGVDIRNDDGIVFAPPTEYFFPDGSVVSYIDLGGELVMPPAYLKDYIKKPTEKKTITIKNNKNVDKPKDIKLNDIVSKLLYHNLLDGQSKGSWDDWRNVALCMKFTTTFEHFDKFSKINKDKYDKEETVSMWNSVNDKYDAMNIGTLMKYA